ncbi:MAG: EAL domain-containing protein [Gallionellaceae bacterium]|nr:EAL domain-containing protein [Gallionellaceae bacterium]
MSSIIHLLYAEDNPQDADLIRTHFEREAADIQLEIVETGARCLARLAERSFDLLLLDNNLPDLDGVDVLNLMRDEAHTLPVVLITGTGDEDVVARALRAGAADYVSKSDENYLVTLPDLLRKQVALHRRHLLDGDRAKLVWDILYVEPNAMDIELTKRHLAVEAPHLQLHAVSNSREALKWLATAQHHFDLVLTDLRIPDLNAPEFMREVQQLGIELPFIIITGKGDEASAVAVLRLGAYDYIVKRENYLTHLPHAIDNALHRFHLDQTTRRLHAELAALNTSLEQKVEARTAQLRQEMELRQASEAGYQHLIETTHELVQSIGPDGHFTFVNHALCEALGWTCEEALQLSFSQIVKPDQLSHCQALFGQLMQGKNFNQVEVTFVAKDGHEIIVEGNLSSIFVDGMFVGTQSFFRDITERKRAEAQLKLAAKVFEQSREAFIITDADRNIVMVNHAFTLITGYSEAEALGKNPRLLHSGRQDENFYRSMWESINTHGHWQGEVLDRRKDGSVFPKWLSISRVLDNEGEVTHYIGIFGDLSQLKQGEAQIQRLAHFDALTGLPNRVLLNDRINLALSTAQRSQQSLAVMFVDLDHFKNVNDTLGHRIGDALLVEVAARLKLAVREEDTVSRLGGDEFILILPGADAAGAAHAAEKLIMAVAQRYQIEQHDLVITPSIGIAIYPSDGEDFEALSKCADVAMYRAKRDGRNNYRFFTPEMQARSARTLALENALRQALQHKQLELYFQPLISLKDGSTIGAEALLRWKHPEFGSVLPGEFIPIAEDSGQILQIGEWVLRSAARQLKTWMDDGMTPIVMAVNLSVVQFRQSNLPDMVMRILDEVQLSPQYLELELTEGVAMDDPLGAIAMMDQLHQRGIRMSIDDFGTGYSSLNYLKRFQVGKLKIDQSFVRDITVDPEDKAIVSAIIRLAGALNLQTIAEGVETAGQLAFLREQGCNEAQGYYFSEALPADQFKAWCGKKRPKLR